MSYKALKNEIRKLNVLLEDSNVTIVPTPVGEPEDKNLEIVPPSPEETKEEEHVTPAVYASMEKIEPRNSKVKAAYADKAVQGSTKFVFVIEELDRGDDEFHGRAAIVCKHAGKLIYAGVSFPQKAKSPIPPNLYKMIPVRGASMPAWVKPYIDSNVHIIPPDEQ